MKRMPFSSAPASVTITPEQQEERSLHVERITCGGDRSRRRPGQVLRNQNWPAFTFPVAPESTHWRDEQRAWSTAVAVMDQIADDAVRRWPLLMRSNHDGLA